MPRTRDSLKSPLFSLGYAGCQVDVISLLGTLHCDEPIGKWRLKVLPAGREFAWEREFAFPAVRFVVTFPGCPPRKRSENEQRTFIFC
jgi:hypothetical protein